MLMAYFSSFLCSLEEVGRSRSPQKRDLLLVKGFGADMEYKKNPRIEHSFDPGISLFYPRMRLRYQLQTTEANILTFTWAGLLTPGSSSSRAFPSIKLYESGVVRRSSPVTAAGPSLICTGFPLSVFLQLRSSATGRHPSVFIKLMIKFFSLSTPGCFLFEWKNTHH